MLQKVDENDRIFYIQNRLTDGETRENIAQKLGYRNWRSLDIFMRRKGMRWDSRRKIYYSAGDEHNSPDNTYSKITTIISIFDKKDADPKQVAVQTGFRDHHEMALYMKSNGYMWSHEANNYIIKSAADDEVVEEDADSCGTMLCSDSQDGGETEADISRYLPLLDLLLKNKEKLLAMFAEAPVTIPRYVVSGTARTKSFYISERISELLNDFSRSKNISQKEIIEAAIIEFLCKYSYRNEVSRILDMNSVLR